MENGSAYPLAPWGQHSLPGEEPVLWKFGPLTLQVKSLGNEVWIAARRDHPEDTQPENTASREAPKWSRWALDRTYGKVDMIPVFPDRPIVVKPEVPFHLIRNGGRAAIYIRVPLWVRVDLVNGNSRITLMEIPITILSDTWFGSYTGGTGGELCYWISSGAGRDLDPGPVKPHLAACSVNIRNNSNEDLHVDKICLVVAYLSLFTRDGQLFSDEAQIDFKGSRESSNFSVSGTAPFPNAVLVSAPRTTAKPDFSARTLLSFMT
ncbi:MAG: hypothetical protein CSYNP_00213 [Syntrophus sp. SKADARSKE-3]|nr:hypothetical protein [Syntrophus sp. SKADARSKE-3]